MYNNIGGFNNFPDINIKDSEKDEEWHKKYVYAISDRCLDSSFDLDYMSIEQCQNYYNGVQDNKALEFIQFAEDGDRLPAFWTNYNKIRPKIDLLIGEYSKKGYRINVKSIDYASKSRKLEKKEDSRVSLRLKPYAKNLESQFGIPLQTGKDFEDEDHLDDFYNYEYREKTEVVLKSALSYSLNMQRWDYERKALMRDLVISGRCHVKTELINGIPKARRIDPKFVFIDKSSTDDYLTDSSYCGEVRYMNLSEASQKYDISKDDLKKAFEKQKNKYLRTTNNSRTFEDNFLKGSTVKPFKNEGGELRVLVLEAYWSDYKKLTYKKSDDKHGNTHLKIITDDTKVNKDISSNHYKIWRKCVLVGGEFLVEWGEVKNMPRSIDDPSDTGCPYKSYIPGYINNCYSSIVNRIIPLQDLKDIALYNMQLAMTRAGAKGFIYDVSQLPEGWDVDNVLKYLKTAGIALINSKQDDGLPPAYNQFQRIDLSLGDEVNKYMEISAMLDREMDNITGINEARQGIVQNASQAVGVTQSALMQSSLTTEEYFDGMRIYVSDIFNYMAGLIKIAWPQYRESYSGIIGDEGVDFLLNDVDLDLEDYAVFAEEIPVSISDTQNLHAIVNTAMQSGKLDIIPALKILKESDIDRGIRMLEREMAKKDNELKRERMMEQQSQQDALAAELESRANEKAIDQEMEKAKMSNDSNTKIAVKKIEGDNKLKEVSAKGKIDIAEGSLFNNK